MAPPDQTVSARTALPDVFTGLLLVAVILLGLACGAMYFKNTEHSGSGRTPGGPISIVDAR